MSSTTLGDLVARYVADPTPDALARLRAVVRGSAGFRPDLLVEPLVRPLLDRGAFDEAVAVLQGLMPGAMLSPSAHGALAEALRGAGRPEQAEREARMARLSVRSILSTGDGSRSHPWSVLRVGDEFDLLRALGRRPRSQSLVPDGERRLDRHECDDGSEAWFDVTALDPEAGA